MAITIDELQVEIQAKSTNAAAGIDSLSASLSKMRSVVKGGAGLTTTTKQFQAFAQSVQAMQDPSGKIAVLVAALKPLESISKSNLGSTLNQLKKIPEITAGLDDAKLSAFAAKIQQVTVAVRPLAAEMEKVSAGFSKLPANIQKAINANAKLTASNNKAGQSYGILGTGISAFAAKLSVVYLAMRRVAGMIAGWIKESNDYVENLNLFTVAMGSYAKEAQKYAESVGDALGIDPSQWMRNQGVFMTLLTGFGVVSDKAALMSKNLTQLGYDLSSFFNIPIETALQKLQSGISGELEPLRRLGYDLSQARLQEIALAQGIKEKVSEMNQAQKSQLRYYAIMTQVTTAQGDMARTLAAPANQLRILQAQATQAARSLGNIFIPALNAVLPYAIAFLKVIRMVADALASLFGFSLPEIDYSGVNGLASGAEDATGALDSATGAAKKLKNQLAGFDELNVITSESGGGAGGGVGGGDLGLKLPEYDFLNGLIESKVEGVLAKIKGFFQDIKNLIPAESFERLKTVFQNFSDAWSKLKGSKAFADFTDLIKKLIALSADIFIVSLANALNAVANALTLIDKVASGDWGGALTSYVKTMGDVDKLLTEPFEKVGKFLDSNWIEPILKKLNLPDWMKTFFSNAGSAGVDGFLSSISGGVLGSGGVLDWAKRVYDAVAGFFSPNSSTAGFGGLAKSISDRFSKAWADTRTAWSVAETFFSALSFNIGKFFGNAWEEITKTFSKAGEWFRTNVTEPIAGFFKGAINSVISALNSLIRGLNKIKIDLPQWDILGDLSGKSYGLNIAQIPMLVTGGFPENGLFFANSSELVGRFTNGRTAVANNDQIVEGISSGVARANSEQNVLLREQNALLRQLLEQERSIVFPTSVEAGRAVTRAVSMYNTARGVT